MRFVPRPDQLEAIESITARLVDDDRTQAIMACGTGKTFVSQKAAELITAGNPDSLILVAVPNLVLVEQMIGEWNRQASPGHEFATLAVNSRRRGKGDEDEITDVALPDVTSSPKEIAAFMLEPGRKVVFSTYQSMAHISSALGLAGEGRPGFQLDLMILDEAHRTAGVTRSDTPTAFKLALDNEKVPAAKRLFMTATPRISKMNRSESSASSASMDNPDLFGRRAITRSLSWAVSEDLLAPYRTYVVQVDDAMLQASLEANPQLRVGGKAASALHVAAAIALAKNARINGLGGIITYSSTIAGAQEFGRVLAEVVATLPEDQKPAGKLTVNHINGGTPADERARILGTLDSSGRAPGDWAVVTNCNCLVEGVNVPSMDAIMFVDPRKSLVSIVQAIGRPMRKDRNNPDKVATIVLPVFVGAHENVQAAIDGGAFEHVNQTITALRDVDDALSEKFVTHLVNRGSEETGVEPEPKGALIAFTDCDGELLPAQPENAVIRVMDPAGDLSGFDGGVREDVWSEWHRGIETALVDDMADGWERGLAALRKFVAREGHTRVPKRHNEDGISLGNWLASLRRLQRRGELSESQAITLSEFEGWEGDPIVDSFSVNVERLRGFMIREGHARVPKAHVEDGFSLGSWISKLRKQYHDGILEPQKVQALDSLGDPSWKNSTVDQFAVGLTLYRKFVDREGNATVPSDHLESGYNLGRWLTKRRQEYRRGTLAPSRVAQLESIEGMHWGVAQPDAFKTGLHLLREFVDREGHALVPTGHMEGGIDLGRWLQSRRSELRKGVLEASRFEQLDAVTGMVWDHRAGAFNDGLDAMRRFVEREGSALVKANHKEGSFLLGPWIHNRRHMLKKGTLPESQIVALDAISPTWRNGALAPWESAPGVRKDEADPGDAA